MAAPAAFSIGVTPQNYDDQYYFEHKKAAVGKD
jgi:hypothetical protein